jgi:drug/metabolite transporter (DMT)-like permease
MVGMSRGPIAIVAPVLGLVSLAVPAILGPVLGDDLSGLEVMGLLLAFPAAALVAISPAHASHNALPTPQALAIAIASGGFLGGAAVCYGRTAPASGIGPGVVSQVTAAALLFAIAALWGRWLRPKYAALLPAAGFGALSGVATVLSVLAYQRGSVAIVAAVLGLAPGPTIVLARFLNHETINPVQLVGFGFGVAAVVLFAFG